MKHFHYRFRIATLVLAGVVMGRMAVALAEPFAYIANAGGDVSVIDTASNTVIATVPDVGQDPEGVAVHPDGSRVYVTNFQGRDVSVIDAVTNTVVARVPLGSNALGIAVHPDGDRVYATSVFDNTVWVIDTASNTAIDTILVGNEPEQVAVHPDGTTLYVVNNAGGTVSVIDTATNAITHTVTVGRFPYGIAIHPDGSTVYVANIGIADQSVSVIDTANNTVGATVAVPTSTASGVAVHPDGSVVYVTDPIGDVVSIIDTATNAVVNTVTVGDTPQGIAVHPDGRSVYVANQNSDDVSVIDTFTNTLEDTIAVGQGPRSWGLFIGPLPAPVGIYEVTVRSSFATTFTDCFRFGDQGDFQSDVLDQTLTWDMDRLGKSQNKWQATSRSGDPLAISFHGTFSNKQADTFQRVRGDGISEVGDTFVMSGFLNDKCVTGFGQALDSPAYVEP